MPLSYHLMTTDEAVSLGLMKPEDKPHEQCAVLYRIKDGKYKMIAMDDDPEGVSGSKTFTSGLSWILAELNFAAKYQTTTEGPLAPPIDQTQADIRGRLALFTARRDGAIRPEDRALYKAKIAELRKECKHPNAQVQDNIKHCSDCGLRV